MQAVLVVGGGVVELPDHEVLRDRLTFLTEAVEQSVAGDVEEALGLERPKESLQPTHATGGVVGQVVDA